MGRARPYRGLIALAAVVLATALAAPAASASNVVQQLIERCGHGESLSGFSQGDYAKALKQLSATTEEYSECAQLIRAAQLAAAANRGNPTGSRAAAANGPLEATAAERRSLAGAASAGARPVSIGGQEIHPGVVHADIASALSTLPTPVLVLLAFLLACALGTGVAIVRRRVRDGHSD
jgi:hypothetical protein